MPQFTHRYKQHHWYPPPAHSAANRTTGRSDAGETVQQSCGKIITRLHKTAVMSAVTSDSEVNSHCWRQHAHTAGDSTHTLETARTHCWRQHAHTAGDSMHTLLETARTHCWRQHAHTAGDSMHTLLETACTHCWRQHAHTAGDSMHMHTQ